MRFGRSVSSGAVWISSSVVVLAVVEGRSFEPGTPTWSGLFVGQPLCHLDHEG